MKLADYSVNVHTKFHFVEAFGATNFSNARIHVRNNLTSEDSEQMLHKGI